MVEEVLLATFRADVPLQFELTRDNFLDRDSFLPTVAAVSGIAARFRHVFRATERTA